MDLKPYYRQRGYAFLDAMPKHPFVKHSIFETVFTRLFDVRNGQYTSGPVAGFKRLFDGSFLTEASAGGWIVSGCAHKREGRRMNSSHNPCSPHIHINNHRCRTGRTPSCAST